MDLLFVARGYMVAISLLESIKAINSRSIPTPVWSSTTSRQCFLKVLDIPLSGERGECVAETTSVDHVNASLDAIPSLGPGTMRVYVEELPDDGALSSHLEDVLGPDSTKVNYRSRFTKDIAGGDNVRALITQWKSPSRWLRTKKFLSLPSHEIRLRNIFNPAAWYPLYGCIETNTSFCSVLLAEQRTVVLISSQSSAIASEYASADNPGTLLINMLELCCQSLLETHLYFKPGGDLAVRKRTCIQLLLLQYLHFHLTQVDMFMNEVNASYALKRLERLDPRRMSLTRSILSEITVDALCCEDLREHSLMVIELVRSAIDIFSETFEDAFIDLKAFRSLRAEIRVECSALDKLASRIVEQFESRLKFFELFRGIQDFLSVWLLTLLACIFLPMSLASGILSMQTRFANLHFLLYDFCGVITIIGSLIVTVFLTLKSMTIIVDRTTKARARFGRSKYVRVVLWPVAVVFSSAVLLIWALIFTSFMVGMIKDIGLGLKILGYGCAAFLGLVLVGVFVALVIVFME